MSGYKPEEVRQHIIDFCERAMRGTLSLEELRSWPSEAIHDTFFVQVYEDVEDGVEHLPGFAFRSGIDWAAWFTSEMYWLIFLDHALLQEAIPSVRLLKCRDEIASMALRNERAIQEAVRECLGREAEDPRRPRTGSR